MKKKIFSIIAVLAFTASFVLPALIPQNAWADTTLEAFCSGHGGMYYSEGKCLKKATKKEDCPDGSSFTKTSSSEGICTLKISSSGNAAGSPATSTTDPDDDDEPTGGNPSKTAGSSGASSAQESSPGQMQKTGDCKEGEVYTSILGGGGCVTVGEGGDLIFSILNTVLTVLTYGVGIAGTLGIIISGIQYLTARDNEAQITKAKSRLINIVIGLAAYALLWAFLQWLIPGGLF